MRAMILERTALLSEIPDPLRLAEIPKPVPASTELLIRVTVCGVCHTELDEIEGRLQPRLPIVPGHEVVGRVEQMGSEATGFSIDDRVGVGWIHSSNGHDDENLASEFVATGCDVNGGYAQYMTVPARYAIPIPHSLTDSEAAPLMCAGAIGYRALRLANLSDGDDLGLMGFGGSAHLVLQMAKHLYPHSTVHVYDRNRDVQQFALRLGADEVGDVESAPTRGLRSIIDTTPAWRPVVESMKKLAPGGRLVINAIRKEDVDKSALLDLSYHEHLWMEREIKSVANLTRADIADFLPLAAAIPLRPNVTEFRLEQANEALRNLRAGAMRGANILKLE